MNTPLFPYVSALVLANVLMGCHLNPMQPPPVIPSATARVTCSAATGYPDVIPWGIGADAQGNFYVGGGTRGDPGRGDFDFFITKYNPNCEPQWTRKFGSHLKDGFVEPTEPFGFHVVVDSAGNSYLMGVTHGNVENDLLAARGVDIAIISYDASGVQRWARQFDGGSKDTPGKLVLGGGNLYAFGSSNGPLAGPHSPPDGSERLANGFVLGLNTSNGQTTLSKQFAEDLHSPYVSGAVKPDGSIVYRGNDLKKLSTSGDELWSRQLYSLGSVNRYWDMDVAASADDLYLLSTTLPVPAPNAVAARPLLQKYNADATNELSRFIEQDTGRDTRGQWVRLDPDQTVTYQTSDYISYSGPSAPGFSNVKTYIRQTSSLHQGWQLELNYAGLGFATGPNPANNTTSVYIAGGGRSSVGTLFNVAKIDVTLH
jgi:hypothetical protein